MQKLRVIYIAVAALVFTGCRKQETENIFDKSVDERLTEALANYQSTLTQAPGWKLFMYPNGAGSTGVEVGGFCYYLKFTDSNRVTMVSDFDMDNMAATPKESGYVLKAFQRPSLVFDTYSYIHVAADPNGNISQTPAGRNGVGWGSDFNFSFTKVETGDTMVLEGNQFGSDAVLVKVSAGEIDSALNKGSLQKMMSATASYTTNNNFLYLPGGNNTKFALSFNAYFRMLKFYFKNDNNSLGSISVPFSFSTKGLWLKQAVSLGGYTFREIFWDNANEYFYIISNGNKIIHSNDVQPTISFPVTNKIGTQYQSVYLPSTPLYGQSAQFASAYAAAKANIKNGGFNLDLQDIDFQFDDIAKRLTLNVSVAQYGTRYLAQTIYAYTFSDDQLKFNFVSENENAGLIKTDMSPLLSFIANDRFTINALSTTYGFLGQITSTVNPGFYFTGYLQ